MRSKTQNILAALWRSVISWQMRLTLLTFSRVVILSADKSMSILLGRPIALRDEDCTVHFPKELDDDWYLLSPTQYLAMFIPLIISSRPLASPTRHIYLSPLERLPLYLDSTIPPGYLPSLAKSLSVFVSTNAPRLLDILPLHAWRKFNPYIHVS